MARNTIGTILVELGYALVTAYILLNIFEWSKPGLVSNNLDLNTILLLVIILLVAMIFMSGKFNYQANKTTNRLWLVWLTIIIFTLAIKVYNFLPDNLRLGIIPMVLAGFVILFYVYKTYLKKT